MPASAVPGCQGPPAKYFLEGGFGGAGIVNSLKKERIRKRIYKTRDMARADVFDYIEVFYNRTRRHSHLGGLSPEAFEQAAA